MRRRAAPAKLPPMRFLLAAACLALPLPAAAQAIPDEEHYAEEVQATAQDPRVRAALRALDGMRARSNADLVAITEVPAPPFAEGPRAALVADRLSETGFGTVTTDEAGNVVARRAGRTGERTIAVLAHLDTVFPEGTDVRVRREGDTFIAPGIGDNSRGVVVLLELARAFEAAGLKTDADLLLVANVGEEGLGDLSGVRHLFREGAAPISALIAVDGGDPARLVTDAVGSKRYEVRYEGPGGHSWSDFGAPNPHHASARAVQLLDDLGGVLAREASAKVSYNVGLVSGGTSVNSIPYESAFLVDLRSGDPGALAAMDAVLGEAARQALAEENEDRVPGTEPLTLTLTPVGDRPAGRGDRAAPLVQRAAAALRRTGLTPEPAASSTDANIPLSLGVPAVTMSRGGISEGAHSREERWTDRDSQRATEAILLTLLAEGGLAGARRERGD